MIRPPRAFPAIAIACVLGLVGCGSGDPAGSEPEPPAEQEEDQATESATAAEETDASEEPAEVPEELMFTATTLDGATFDGASLAGRPAALWFWAPWCPNCITQAPAVAELAEEYEDEVQVVGVGGLDSEEETLRGFVSDTGTGGFPHLSDNAGEVWTHFEVTYQHTFVLLDSSGAIVEHGSLTDAELADHFANLAA